METKNFVAIFMNDQGRMSVMNFAHNVYVPVDEDERRAAPFITIGDGSYDDPKSYRKATLEELIEKDAPKGVDIHIVGLDQIPEDRYFRNAWLHDNEGKVNIDMEKAVEIHKDKLREERAPMLAALDLEYMRADEAGDSQKKLDIVQKKNALRDITNHPEILSAATPEELKMAAVLVLREEK